MDSEVEKYWRPKYESMLVESPIYYSQNALNRWWNPFLGGVSYLDPDPGYKLALEGSPLSLHHRKLGSTHGMSLMANLRVPLDLDCWCIRTEFPRLELIKVLYSWYEY